MRNNLTTTLRACYQAANIYSSTILYLFLDGTEMGFARGGVTRNHHLSTPFPFRNMETKPLWLGTNSFLEDPIDLVISQVTLQQYQSVLETPRCRAVERMPS